MTRKLIQHADGAILDNAGETLVHQTVIRVYNELEHAAPIQWTMNMQTALIKIAESCHQLSNLLHCQKARFCVTMLVAVHEDGSPRLFKPDLEEEDFFDGNEEDPHDRTVEMSLFPVIWKLGDEHGENVRQRLTQGFLVPLLTCHGRVTPGRSSPKAR